MKLESQVCSLDLAKRLKELGVLQSGAFDYYENTLHPEQPFIVLRPTVNVMKQSPNWICSAFTVAELGEMLPTNILSFRFNTEIEGDASWSCVKTRIPEFEIDSETWQTADTEVDARAKMLIYLIEQGILKP